MAEYDFSMFDKKPKKEYDFSMFEQPKATAMHEIDTKSVPLE